MAPMAVIIPPDIPLLVLLLELDEVLPDNALPSMLLEFPCSLPSPRCLMYNIPPSSVSRYGPSRSSGEMPIWFLICASELMTPQFLLIFSLSASLYKSSMRCKHPVKPYCKSFEKVRTLHQTRIMFNLNETNKYNILPQFGITECLIQYKCSVHTPPSHAIRSG